MRQCQTSHTFCTGKTLLARAIASNIDANFLKVVSSAIVDKYIGESARLIREMFGYAKEHQPCIIFMDEIDAIGGRRFSEGTSADREIQRTLMELLSQLDGFDVIGKACSPFVTTLVRVWRGSPMARVIYPLLGRLPSQLSSADVIGKACSLIRLAL